MKPSRVAILGASEPVYERFCPNFTGMQKGLADLGIEYRLFNIRPDIIQLDMQALVDFDPDLIVYGLLDMVKAQDERRTIRNKFPNARIVMWYGDLRLEQPRYDMSEIDAMFVSNDAQSEFYKRVWRVPECHFLPLGSQIYAPEYSEKFDFECVFIGGLITGKHFIERAYVMNRLKMDSLIKHIDGPVWKPALRAKIMKEMPAIYRSSRTSLDWSHFTDIEGYTSNRHWIITASGGFSLSHRYPGCEKWYPEGTRVYFDDIDDFITKRAYYLEHEEEREKIRAAGYEHAKHHTYADRFGRMFKILYGTDRQN